MLGLAFMKMSCLSDISDLGCLSSFFSCFQVTFPTTLDFAPT